MGESWRWAFKDDAGRALEHAGLFTRPRCDCGATTDVTVTQGPEQAMGNKYLVAASAEHSGECRMLIWGLGSGADRSVAHEIEVSATGRFAGYEEYTVRCLCGWMERASMMGHVWTGREAPSDAHFAEIARLRGERHIEQAEQG